MSDVINADQWPQYLQGVADDLQETNFEDCLRNQVGPVIRDRIDMNFALEQTGTGEAWKPLAPSTVKRKGHDRILVETGAMRTAATTTGAGHTTEVTERAMNDGVDQAAIPYAIFHQLGTRKLAQREFIGINEDTVERMAGRIADFTVRALKR